MNKIFWVPLLMVQLSWFLASQASYAQQDTLKVEEIKHWHVTFSLAPDTYDIADYGPSSQVGGVDTVTIGHTISLSWTQPMGESPHSEQISYPLGLTDKTHLYFTPAQVRWLTVGGDSSDITIDRSVDLARGLYAIRVACVDTADNESYDSKPRWIYVMPFVPPTPAPDWPPMQPLRVFIRIGG